jgi:hypothetical protein
LPAEKISLQSLAAGLVHRRMLGKDRLKVIPGRAV